MSGKKVVCVTGATGYIAGFTVKLFLEAGHDVRATVRNPDPSNKQLDFLREMAESETVKKAGGTLTFFKADLFHPESFDVPFKGSDVVVHMAAVVGNSIAGEEYGWGIVKVGVDGARNIGIAARKAKVPRMVYTSSIAAIVQKENYRHPARRGKPFDESEFRLDNRPDNGPYEAEKSMSEIALKEEYFGDLIIINPSLVIGPLLEKTVRSSMEVMRLLANRELGFFCPNMRIASVDVRDVAKAHFCGAFTKLPEDIRNRRFIISLPEITSCAEMSTLINKNFPHLNAPTRALPQTMMHVFKHLDARMSNLAAEEYPMEKPGFNTERSKTELDGFSYEYTTVETMVKASIESLMKFGVTPSPQK